MDAFVSLHHVQKNYQKTTVLQDVDFVVPKGSIFGFVGKNGAGKTTTMRLILGLEPLDSGEIIVGEQVVAFGQNRQLNQIGYVADVPNFYPYLSGQEYLQLCGEIAGMSKSDLQSVIPELLVKVGLPVDQKKIKGYSRGMKQRLAIAQGLLGDPELLICDEPTSALDPKGRDEILQLLYSLRGQTTVIFSTHILEDVERICDHVAMLDQGRIVCQGAVETLKQQFAPKQVELQILKSDLAKWQHVLATQATSKIEVQQQDTRLYFRYDLTEKAFFHWLMQLVATHELYFETYTRTKWSLETLFLEVIA